MKTQELFNGIISLGYNAEITSTFSYDVDKNRRFKLITIEGNPTVELFHLVDSYDAFLRVGVLNTASGERKVIYEVCPKNMNDIDFE